MQIHAETRSQVILDLVRTEGFKPIEALASAFGVLCAWLLLRYGVYPYR